MPVIKEAQSEHEGVKRYHFYCPGCKEVHAFNSTWKFNGDMEKPTVSPSLLVTAGKNIDYRCHSFIKEGKIQFLNDCTHDLKGKTVDLEDFHKCVTE